MVVPMFAMISVSRAHRRQGVVEIEVRDKGTLAHCGPTLGDVPGVHGPESCRDINKVKQAKEKCNLLKGPVPAAESRCQQQQGDAQEA